MEYDGLVSYNILTYQFWDLAGVRDQHHPVDPSQLFVFYQVFLNVIENI